jgi:cytochrome c oxidase assembly protein subunit 15
MNTTSKHVIIWLYTGIILILLMTVIGGITRLTHSGLSIVEWSIFSEAPLFPSTQEWNVLFNQYKATPEFKYINADFTLSDFKSIFWWEYIHRMWGRMIGLVFIIPLIYFLIQKKISKPLQNRLFFVLLLGAFQGFLGWYMVKSGLINEPSVSHFRLAAHLITAFLTCSYIYWIILETKATKSSILLSKFPKYLIGFLFGFILLQIMYGAFVAGLKAGFILNTFPSMNGEYFPSYLSNNILSKIIHDPVGVQFIHRMTAYLIVLLTTVLYTQTKNHSSKELQSVLYPLYSLVGIQVLLGILTLIYQVPLWMGVLHQLIAFILLLTMVRLLFVVFYSKTNRSL